MTHDILNTTILANICSLVKRCPGDKALLAAIRENFPQFLFSRVAVRGGWGKHGALLDAHGNRVAASYVAWLAQEYKESGQDARKVWLKHKDAGMVTTFIQGETIYFTAPLSSDPAAFVQLEINAIREVTERQLFTRDYPPTSNELHDLQHPCFIERGEQKPLAPWSYQVQSLVDVAQYMQEMLENEKANRLAQLPELERKTILVQEIILGDGGAAQAISDNIPFFALCPDWLNKPLREFRLLQDWQESSAGRKELFCRHWALELKDYIGWNSERRMGFIPVWADADGGLKLQKITVEKCRTVYGLMEQLERFDAKAGYPFAWFFYMVHGNRIQPTVGETIATGIRQGKIRLPDHDERILLRWVEQQSGF